MEQPRPAWLILTVIAIISGLLLSAVYTLTAPVIEQRAQASKQVGLYTVFPQADAFEALSLTEEETLQDCYIAKRGEETLGHVGSVTVAGYGGEIEVTAGISKEGGVTGISVGGEHFSETAGLGARTRDLAFTEQFAGISLPAALGENVDAVSGATISSGAVVSGVNKIARSIQNIGKDPSQTNPYRSLLPERYETLPHDDTVDAAYATAEGYVVYVTQTGYHGPIHAAVALDFEGRVIQVAIDQDDFQETAGLGERVLEDWFLVQFVGANDVVGVAPGVSDDAVSSATGESGTAEGQADASDAIGGATPATEGIEGASSTIDGVSGATVSSIAVAKAVNAAIAFAKSLA